MTTSSRFRGVRVLMVGVLLASAGMIAAPALAQGGSSGGSKKKEVQLLAPTPPGGKSDIPWMPYAAAIVLALIVIGVNFIPSKRGHQD